jgi:hypothetical protein
VTEGWTVVLLRKSRLFLLVWHSLSKLDDAATTSGMFFSHYFVLKLACGKKQFWIPRSLNARTTNTTAVTTACR